MAIVWRVRGKIIRSVLCNIVWNNCAQWNAHTWPNSSLDWVLSHWAHFTVLRFIFVHVLFCVWLYIACVCTIVTWWGGPGGFEAWSLVPLLPSLLWHCRLSHLTRKNPSPIWPIVFRGMLNSAQGPIGRSWGWWILLCLLVDVIWAMMIVCRIRGKIIRTVLCCIVYDSRAQWHTHKQFLQLTVGFRFSCLFVWV